MKTIETSMILVTALLCVSLMNCQTALGIDCPKEYANQVNNSQTMTGMGNSSTGVGTGAGQIKQELASAKLVLVLSEVNPALVQAKWEPVQVKLVWGQGNRVLEQRRLQQALPLQVPRLLGQGSNPALAQAKWSLARVKQVLVQVKWVPLDRHQEHLFRVKVIRCSHRLR